MGFFNRTAVMAAIGLAGLVGVLAGGLPVGSASAQVQPRAVGDVADRLERIQRLSGQYPDAMMRTMPEPRGAALERAMRAGAVAERMSFGARDFPVRRNEVLGLDLAPASMATARALGFEVLRSFDLDTLGIRIDVLRAPRGQSVRRALRRLREADLAGAYEANSMFEPSSEPSSELSSAPSSAPSGASLAPGYAPVSSVSGGSAPARLGVIDTGADASAPPFAGAALSQRNFGRGEGVTPRAHGTAVAALAFGYGAREVLVADAFSGEPAYADAEALARALDWLAGEGTGVVNMSLAGPPNALVEKAVARALARGHVIVAAVGNQGPDVSPQYPAAYPGVIGVTAVDARYEVYDRANRGEGVDVAAIGVDLAPPSGEDDAPLSGTSYAAPFVSAYLARRTGAPAPGALDETRRLIEAAAVDLGAPGFDAVYGAGLLIGDGYRTASGLVSE